MCLWHRDAIHWAKHYTLYTIFCCCHCHILSLFLFNLLFFSLLLSNERHTLNSFGDNDWIALFTHTLRKWSTPSFKWYINQSLFDYTAIFTHSHARTHTHATIEKQFEVHVFFQKNTNSFEVLLSRNCFLRKTEKNGSKNKNLLFIFCFAVPGSNCRLSILN